MLLAKGGGGGLWPHPFRQAENLSVGTLGSDFPIGAVFEGFVNDLVTLGDALVVIPLLEIHSCREKPLQLHAVQGYQQQGHC